MGAKTPDFKGRFLRGLDAGHAVGERVEDTFKSHVHGQPEHTHSWNGQLASTALTGTAAGQKYVDWHTGVARTVPSGLGQYSIASVVQGISVWGDGVHYSADNGYAFSKPNDRTANASSVSGKLVNGTVNGTVGSGGGDNTLRHWLCGDRPKACLRAVFHPGTPVADVADRARACYKAPARLPLTILRLARCKHQRGCRMKRLLVVLLLVLFALLLRGDTRP